MDRQRIAELYEKGGKLYIYGAGKHAGDLFLFLGEKGIQVHGFVVSDMADNPENLFEIPVMEVKDFSKSQDSIVLVSITKSSIHYRTIFQNLVKNQIKNIVFLTDDFIKKMQLELLQKTFEKRLKQFFDTGIYYLGEHVPVESYHRILAMKGIHGEEYHWRVGRTFTEKCPVSKVSELFVSKTALEEFEEQYGTYYVFHALEQPSLERQTSCSVYMAYSPMDKTKVRKKFPKWLIPIQVGAAFTDTQDGSDIRDNSGENISEKNGNYSECTALYWMWKHAPKTDYIGLCHYRRHFDISEHEFSGLEEHNIDVLVTSPTFVAEGIEAFFSALTPHTDIEMLLRAIHTVQPEYLPTAECFFKTRFFPPCNLSIMRYGLFQEYAQFIFSVTFEVERFYDDMGFCRRDRYMGYLAECLLGIFLMHNKERLKIAYTDMLFYS